MPHFRLVSATDPDRTIEIDGVNAAAALDIAVRRAMPEAAVFQDGRYLFTAKHGQSGIWVISHDRPSILAAENDQTTPRNARNSN